MDHWTELLWALAFVAGAAAVGLGLHAVLLLVATRVTRRIHGRLDDTAVGALSGPARLLLPVLAAHFVLSLLRVPEPAEAILRHALVLLLIGGVAWLIAALIGWLGTLLITRQAPRRDEGYKHRLFQTRVRMLTHIASIVVAVAAGAVMLTTFPRARELGASILASAGLAGIVAGFAARPVLQNLIAGLQIALTQPISLGDQVIIDKEFGTVESIGASYVVVRTWDLRRLIVPLTRVVENTFENWTYQGTGLIGTVFLHVDYSVSVEQLRQEFQRVLAETPQWDGQAAALQVVDTTEHAVKVRAIMSAADADACWNLRCLVLERLIGFVQERAPDSLPKLRLGAAPLAQIALDGRGGPPAPRAAGAAEHQAARG